MNEEYVNRVRHAAEVKEEFSPLEDGYYYFFPSLGGGGFTAVDLRILADYLDEKNAKWDAQIKEFFENERNST